ncbi:hypothetical protein CCACVL1_22766 [Corchorus capsularis]|uniref:Uncharacterized protein n=1 Tax=Corchorus capsularis TaxID=210143 RepID=A0A1R3GWR4_COCAP|nr:hypothetical protein CCACVL1_22766 [Corchorus capsularis]
MQAPHEIEVAQGIKVAQLRKLLDLYYEIRRLRDLNYDTKDKIRALKKAPTDKIEALRTKDKIKALSDLYDETEVEIKARQVEYIKCQTGIEDGLYVLSNALDVEAFARFLSLHADQYPRVRASINGGLAQDDKKRLSDFAKELGIDSFWMLVN